MAVHPIFKPALDASPESTERRALRRLLEFVRDLDPEQVDTRDPGCNLCTQGCTPLSHDKGLCPIHEAEKVLG